MTKDAGPSPDTTICLSRNQIDAALPRVEKGLQQYLWLQSRVDGSNDFAADAEFRRRFNHFYRVRRATPWQNEFYGLMDRAKQERLEFPAVLRLLYEATNRYEASFASKLVATLDPSNAVIDRVVLKNLGLRLPTSRSPDREARICKVHAQLILLFSAPTWARTR